MRLRNRLWLWLTRYVGEDAPAAKPMPAYVEEASSRLASCGIAQYRFTILPASNGRLLEVGTFKPNPRGPDWTFELVIVREGERLSEVIERTLAIKKLEN